MEMQREVVHVPKGHSTALNGAPPLMLCHKVSRVLSIPTNFNRVFEWDRFSLLAPSGSGGFFSNFEALVLTGRRLDGSDRDVEALCSEPVRRSPTRFDLSILCPFEADS